MPNRSTDNSLLPINIFSISLDVACDASVPRNFTPFSGLQVSKGTPTFEPIEVLDSAKAKVDRVSVAAVAPQSRELRILPIMPFCFDLRRLCEVK
mgnify:CR=1 FL=1